MAMSVAAISSSASVALLKPPVSTSMATGRKPRNRRAMSRAPGSRATAGLSVSWSFDNGRSVSSAATGTARLDDSAHEAPGDLFACAHRHELIGAVSIVHWHRPRLLHELDPPCVAGKAVKVRTEVRGECLESGERPSGFEGFGVQLDARMRG